MKRGRKISSNKLVRCARRLVAETDKGWQRQEWKMALFDVILEAERIRIKLYARDNDLTAMSLWRDE